MMWMDKNYGIAEMPLIAAELAEVISRFKVVTFSGNLGAGKTTLIKTLCQLLGVEDAVSSPTYSLVNQYKCNAENKESFIYHIDLYRVKGEEEAYDAGIEDNLYSGHLCLVEWPEKALGIIPEKSLKVEITYISSDQRHIEVVSAEN
jgi:tRNA threonylcarbamoyladenosine biosynthesis protein TsaE